MILFYPCCVDGVTDHANANIGDLKNALFISSPIVHKSIYCLPLRDGGAQSKQFFGQFEREE